jgi:ABC-type uncharacterized transport system involved in gliding motility auxiliary subunit
MNREKMTKISFIFGVTLIVMAALVATVRGEFELPTIIAAALGVAGVAAYVAINFSSVKELFSNKAARYGFNAFIYTMMVVAIIILAQTIFTIHSKTFDLTKAKHYEISDQTKKVLDSLKTGVEAYLFYSSRAPIQQAQDTLELYAKESPKFKFTAVDADRNPSIASRFKVDRYGVVVLFKPDNNAQEKVDTLTEEGITNGLIRITRGSKKKIYFTKGHGEPAIDAPQNEKTGISALKGELEAYNYQVDSVELFSQPSVPPDASILVVAGPQIDIFDREAASINAFLRSGGKLLVLDAPMVQLPNLNALLKGRGINAQNDIIVDKMGKMFGGDPLMPIIASYDQHEITSSLRVASFMPNCRSFELKNSIAGVTLSPLARTGQGSWGETDLAGVRKGTVKQDASDFPSPLIVGAAAAIDNSAYKSDSDPDTNPSKAEIVVYGSSDFMNNTFLGASGNKDLALNTFNFLAGEGDTIAVKPKDNSFEPLFLSKIQGRMLFIIPIIFIPLLVTAIGIAVFVRRRAS